MIDAHVHLEKGSYSIAWIQKFISHALSRGIDEIYFLEHTHIFIEFEELYKEMSHYNEYQKHWYEKKRAKARPLQEYTDFIENMKKEKFPLKVKFGLEVCYSPEHEVDIEKIKHAYPFDFLVGAVHFIDGWAFSHLKQPWRREDCEIESLYHQYYEKLYALADSGLFTGLAHPNSQQCFGAYPVGDFGAEYERIAAALKKNHMYIEESSGLAINYGDPELGMNQRMLETMLKHNITVLTASDAHIPENTGKLIREMDEMIANSRRKLGL